jgi:hypothetical protein
MRAKICCPGAGREAIAAVWRDFNISRKTGQKILNQAAMSARTA